MPVVARHPRKPKPRWQRLIIAFAGPFMNVVLAVGLLTGLYMVEFQRVADADMQAVIGHVMPGSPAAKAGIQRENHKCGPDQVQQMARLDHTCMRFNAALLGYRFISWRVCRSRRRSGIRPLPRLPWRLSCAP